MPGNRDDQELQNSVRAAFARYDEDTSGGIDAKELKHLVEDLGDVLTAQELHSALQVLDRDGNGVIDQNEFLGWWMQRSSDLDGDGVVSGLEKTLSRLKELGRERFHVDIHTAAWNAFDDVITRLLEDDAELVQEKDTTEYGNLNTALHYAAYQNNIVVARVLIDNGANVNAVNASGCAPIFYAAQQSHAPMVELLLQKGADLKLQEHTHHLTPVDVCTADVILQLLKNNSGSCPSIPAAPKLQASGSRQLIVTWSAPKSNLNQVAPISAYKIKLVSKNAPPRSVVVAAIPTETLIDQLCSDTEYVAQIAAINLNGASELSETSAPMTTIAAKPSAPVLRSTHVESQSVTLSWELVENEKSTHCVLYQSIAGADELWMPVAKLDASVTTMTVNDLFSNRKYLFRIAAINLSGRGEFSDTLTVRTASKTTYPTTKSAYVMKAVHAFASSATTKEISKLVPEAQDNKYIGDPNEQIVNDDEQDSNPQPEQRLYQAAAKFASLRHTKEELKSQSSTFSERSAVKTAKMSDDEEDYLYYSSDSSDGAQVS